MADFDYIEDFESLKQNVSDLAYELNAWLNTSDTLSWTGVTSALSAAGVGFFPFGYYDWEDADVAEYADEEAAKLWRDVLAAYNDDKWLDKVEYYGARSEFDDESGIFYGDGYGEYEVEYYEEEGMTNEEANDKVMANLGEMADLAIDYARGLLGALRKLEDYLNSMAKSIRIVKTVTDEELEDLLPHGSGINYDWSFERSGEDITAYNRWDVMNSNGYYIGAVGFSFTLTYDPDADAYTMGDVEFDEGDVNDLTEASEAELPDIIRANVDTFTDMSGDELTDDEINRITEDSDEIYTILEERGYDTDGANYASEESYPDWGEPEAEMLTDYLNETLYYALKESGTVKGAAVRVKAFKASRIGSTMDGEELTSDDGYYYAQGGSDAQSIAENALGLEDIHGYTDDEIMDATNAIALVDSGEYEEIWLTWSGRWYNTGTEYELVFTSEALHDWIRDKKD